VTLPYVELNRLFYPVSEAVLDDVENLLNLAESAFGYGTLTWTELLKFPRALILAQGGVGKTREMEEQAARLRQEGSASFFMPLERLMETGSFSDLLSFDEEELFSTWMKDQAQTGWFFLDSVDELKLAQGSLQSALQRFARSLGRDGLRRARVFLSCRPKDWSETIDRKAVRNLLEQPIMGSEVAFDSDEEFEAGLTRQPKPQTSGGHEGTDLSLQTVMLLPLDRQRARELVRALGVSDVDNLMDEITRRNSDELVKRPMDVQILVGSWQKNGQLGTLTDQISQNIEKNLVEEEGSHRTSSLAPARAREGVERLALAMVLGKRSVIRATAPVVEGPCNNTSLNVEEVLNDWRPEERDSLLRLPIFDLAAIGQVRFHHRSIRDYLAAERLRELRARNLPWHQLKRMLVAELYGETVIIPSMRGVAAWLSRWNDDVREILRRIERKLGKIPGIRCRAVSSAAWCARGERCC